MDSLTCATRPTYATLGSCAPSVLSSMNITRKPMSLPGLMEIVTIAARSESARLRRRLKHRHQAISPLLSSRFCQAHSFYRHLWEAASHGKRFRSRVGLPRPDRPSFTYPAGLLLSFSFSRLLDARSSFWRSRSFSAPALKRIGASIEENTHHSCIAGIGILPSTNSNLSH